MTSHTIDRWRSTLDAATPWRPPRRRTIIVAPHPDDESLSTGGLIAFQRKRSIEVIVVAVTDGEASYDPAGDHSLGVRRRAEQESALAALGVGPDSISCVSLADSRVAASQDVLCDRLVDIVRPDDLLVATWNRDVHPDHEACGRAALAASEVVAVTLVFSLFWTWHHRDVGDIDRHRLLEFDLPAEVHTMKQQAVRQHVSQFESDNESPSILDDHIVEPATWSCEYFLASESERSR